MRNCEKVLKPFCTARTLLTVVTLLRVLSSHTAHDIANHSCKFRVLLNPLFCLHSLIMASWCRRNVAVADPDLQIRGGPVHPDPEIRRGGRRQKNLFSALWASFWSKNKGGRAPRAPPLDPPLRRNTISLFFTCLYFSKPLIRFRFDARDEALQSAHVRHSVSNRCRSPPRSFLGQPWYKKSF